MGNNFILIIIIWIGMDSTDLKSDHDSQLNSIGILNAKTFIMKVFGVNLV